MVEVEKSQRLILAWFLFLAGCQPINCGEKELEEGLLDLAPEGQKIKEKEVYNGWRI